MNRKSINNLLNENGIFYFVDEKENKFNGKLIEQNNNYFLKTDIKETFGINNPGIIVGQINDINVTFYKIHIWNPFKTFTFLVDYVFVNYDYKSELSFKQVNIRYYNLEDWICEFPVSFQSKKNCSILTPNNGCVIFNNIKSSITFVLSYLEIHSLTSFCVKSNHSIQIQYDDKTNFEEILRDMRFIKNFLTFSMNVRTEIRSIECVIGAESNHFNKVEVYSKVFRNETHEINPLNVLIKFNEIKFKTDFFNNWFEINKKFKPLFDIYFTNFSNDMNLEYEFLSYSQALESYMRKNERYVDLYMGEDDYENIKKELYDLIDNAETGDDHKNSLKSRIHFGNEVSLRKRLRELINDLEGYDIINKVIEGDKEKFISNVVDNRNYYTHYDETSDFERDVNNLLLLNFKLKLIIELCILREAGFENEFIDEKLNLRYDYKPVFL